MLISIRNHTLKKSVYIKINYETLVWWPNFIIYGTGLTVHGLKPNIIKFWLLHWSSQVQKLFCLSCQIQAVANCMSDFFALNKQFISNRNWLGPLSHVWLKNGSFKSIRFPQYRSALIYCKYCKSNLCPETSLLALDLCADLFFEHNLDLLGLTELALDKAGLTGDDPLSHEQKRNFWLFSGLSIQGFRVAAAEIVTSLTV